MARPDLKPSRNKTNYAPVCIASALALALAALVAVVAASTHIARATAVADETGDDLGPLCFYQNGHLTCVKRPKPALSSAGRATPPEALLTALLAGPTPQERTQGIESAIPSGTQLVATQVEGQAITVRLAFPDGFLTGDDQRWTTDDRPPTTFNALASEAIVQQIFNTLFPLGYRDLRVEAEDPTAPGNYRPLSSYLPPLTVPAKDALPSAVLREPETRNTQYATRNSGQPPIESPSHPQGALTGKTVYISAGHGWQWNGYGWRTQRPPYPDASTGYAGPIIEDHNNVEVVNQYLLRYLQNAGADVWTARERDMNSFEDVVDDAALGFGASSGWGTVDGEGYSNRHLTAATTLSATAAATWTVAPPAADGVYALYIWYVPGPDRASDACYTVYHAGGVTALHVDQRHHGHTWRYVGRFPVRAGERLTVSLSNQSATPGQVVVADAVRLGGGTFDSLAGIESEAPNAPDEPWWEVAAYYQTQRLGVDPDDFAYFNDVIARPLWARWEHQDTGDDAIYVSWHTNGYNGHNDEVWGSVSFVHSFQPVTGSAALRHAIHGELVNDARAGWDSNWRDLGEASMDLGELRELWDDVPADAIPGALIEIAYHDHVGDTDALKDPRFALLSARAVYQGIVKYFEEKGGVDLTLLPEPPTHLTVRNDGPGQVTLSWRPPLTDSVGLVGDAAESYRVYASHDGLGWDDGRLVVGTNYVFTDVQENELIFVRVTAVNAGGESFPTPTLAARASAEGVGQILLVDGFDRIDRHGLILENDPTEGTNARLFPDQINRYDYAIEHGSAISLPFDSALNEAVAAGDLSLGLYSIVDWILGEESSVDRTFDAAEQAAVSAYLEGEGALFISGAEIGWDLVYRGNGPDFYRTFLGADWAGDDADTYVVTPAAGIFTGLGSFDFRDNYDADYPDQLTPLAGSVAALTFVGGGGGTAAVQHEGGGCRRVVYLAFPFETIDETKREAVMGRVLNFLGRSGCLTVAPQTAITTPVSGGAFSVFPALGGTAIGFNPVERVEVQLGEPGGGYWDGQAWITASQWLTAVGTMAWHYPSPPTAPAQGTYQLRARAWDTTTLSDTRPALSSFIYDTISPSLPSLITPTNGSVHSFALAQFVWDGPVTDTGSTLGYNLQIDDQLFTQTITRYIPPEALAPGPHTWRVRAFDAAGNRSPWTDTWSFRVSRHDFYLPLVLKSYDGDEPEANLIVNGGFETDGGWDLNTTGYPATFVTAPVHSGQRAAQARVPEGQNAFSSLAQTLTLPDQGPLVLSLWFYPVYADDDTGDLQYISLVDESDAAHLLWLARQDDQEWLPLELDLTPYRGQAVCLRFGARNDGDDATAALVVDDLHLNPPGQ